MLWMARIVPRSLLVTPMGGAVHGRRGRAPKTPTLLDVLWVRGRLKLQNHERSLPRVLELEPTSYSVTTRIVGGGIMSKRNLVIEEGSVEALARLQKQDEEFCRRLRAAIETGRECCPTTVFTEPCTNRPVSNYMRPDLIRVPRRPRSPCCARAASGHAAAAPPSSDMNSRRLLIRSPRRRGRSGSAEG